MFLYKPNILDKNICIVIDKKDFLKIKNLIEEYFVKNVYVTYNYNSTDGSHSEILIKGVLLLVPAFFISQLLLVVNIPLILNLNDLPSVNFHDGTKLSISCS